MTNAQQPYTHNLTLTALSPHWFEPVNSRTPKQMAALSLAENLTCKAPSLIVVVYYCCCWLQLLAISFQNNYSVYQHKSTSLSKLILEMPLYKLGLFHAVYDFAQCASIQNRLHLLIVTKSTYRVYHNNNIQNLEQLWEPSSQTFLITLIKR